MTPALYTIACLAAGAIWFGVFQAMLHAAFGPRKRNFGIKQEDKR